MKLTDVIATNKELIIEKSFMHKVANELGFASPKKKPKKRANGAGMDWDFEEDRSPEEIAHMKAIQDRGNAKKAEREAKLDVPAVDTNRPSVQPSMAPERKNPHNPHQDNGGVGPRFGDFLEHGAGLWKIIGNDSANMTAIIQDPKSGRKAKLGWDKMVKDRDHKGKAIFVKG